MHTVCDLEPGDAGTVPVGHGPRAVIPPLDPEPAPVPGEPAPLPPQPSPLPGPIPEPPMPIDRQALRH
jgi:hypothetical protein